MILERMVGYIRNRSGEGLINWIIVIIVVATMASLAAPRIMSNIEGKSNTSINRLDELEDAIGTP